MLALFIAWGYGVALYLFYLLLLRLWREGADAVLVGLFFGSLTAAQFIANKLVDYGVGVAPAGTVIFMTNVAVLDAMAIYFGRQFALRAVRLGFFFQAAVAFAAWSASTLPPPAWFADRAAVVDSVIAPSARIAVASTYCLPRVFYCRRIRSHQVAPATCLGKGLQLLLGGAGG